MDASHASLECEAYECTENGVIKRRYAGFYGANVKGSAELQE
jgi:hypothetical protein